MGKKINLNTVLKKSEDVPSKRVDDEIMLLNLDNGDYFSLNEVGFFIWDNIDGKKQLSKINSKLSKSYKIKEETAEKDTLDFANSLHKKNLVEIIKFR